MSNAHICKQCGDTHYHELTHATTWIETIQEVDSGKRELDIQKKILHFCNTNCLIAYYTNVKDIPDYRLTKGILKPYFEEAKPPVPSITCAALIKHERLIKTAGFEHYDMQMIPCGDPAVNICTRCKKDLCAWHTRVNWSWADEERKTPQLPICENCSRGIYYFERPTKCLI